MIFVKTIRSQKGSHKYFTSAGLIAGRFLFDFVPLIDVLQRMNIVKFLKAGGISAL